MASRALVTALTTKRALSTNQPWQPPNSILTPSPSVPRPSTSRLDSSRDEQPYCLEQYVQDAPSKAHTETVLYLAYGSNFSAEKFKGDRGVKPLAQIAVQVPSLRLTFDLPGIPYLEPCFANTARRDPDNDPPKELADASNNETTALLDEKTGYRKTKWHKGLIGVVYEVTPEDYAHIIATEGGGAGYRDILVDCHPFETADPNAPVPQNPTLPPFKAHTLFAPAVSDGDGPPKDDGHLQRPDPNYAQASARYLKLITDGAAECELPYEYQDWLRSLQPYTPTTKGQKTGMLIFSVTWAPIIMMLFQVSKLFVDENGRLPPWLRKLMGLLFEAVWSSYDNVFRPAFGDGERTIDNGQNNDAIRRRDVGDVEKGV